MKHINDEDEEQSSRSSSSEEEEDVSNFNGLAALEYIFEQYEALKKETSNYLAKIFDA